MEDLSLFPYCCSLDNLPALDCKDNRLELLFNTPISVDHHRNSDSESSESKNSDKLDEMMMPGSNRITVVELLNTFCSRPGYFLDSNGNKIRVSDVDFEGKSAVILSLDQFPVRNATFDGIHCWALKNSCSSWPDFHLIFNVDADNINDASDYLRTFLSAFPCSCLAYPTRGLVPDAVVLLPNGKLTDFECRPYLLEYGAEFYPFTWSHRDQMDASKNELRGRRPVLLHHLLGLHPSSPLYNIQDHTHFISLSDLKEKLVGFYLLWNGSILTDVDRICAQCQAKDRELTIVIVFNPVWDDPHHFQDAVSAYLRNRGVSSSWWALPFNDSTTRRLWRLCSPLDEYDQHEQFMVVGPGGKFLELRAAVPIRSVTDDLYPYASEPLAREEAKRLRSLTLESLLLPANRHDYLNTPTGKRVLIKKALRGKKVILCLVDFVCPYIHELPQDLRDWFRSNGRRDAVLVLVPLGMTKRNLELFTHSSPDTATPRLLICPPDPVRNQIISKEIRIKGLGYSQFPYLAFGEDGRICSVSNCLYPYMATRRGNGRLPRDIYKRILNLYVMQFSI